MSHLPDAVGSHPAHFDLFLARKELASGQATGDWLVLHLQELISLAYQVLLSYDLPFAFVLNIQDKLKIIMSSLSFSPYQISTIQFETMQPVGVSLLGIIVDKVIFSL